MGFGAVTDADECALVAILHPYLTGDVPDTERPLMRAGILLGNLLYRICANDGCRGKP
jgi:hypothetical protein